MFRAKLLAAPILAGAMLAGGALANDIPTSIAIADEDTSEFVVASQLRALGFDAVDVTGSRGAEYHATANWEGRQVALLVDAAREQIILKDDAGDAGGMPTGIALFGDNTDIFTVERALRSIGFDRVDIIEQKGAKFEVAAAWRGDDVRLLVDADLDRIERVARTAMQSDMMPRRIGFADDDTTPFIVARHLRALGYTDVSVLEQKGAVFYARADWRGQSADLRIDASTGRIAVL